MEFVIVGSRLEVVVPGGVVVLPGGVGVPGGGVPGGGVTGGGRRGEEEWDSGRSREAKVGSSILHLGSLGYSSQNLGSSILHLGSLG